MLQRAAEAPGRETRPRELGQSRSAALYVGAGAGAPPALLPSVP